MKAKVELDNRCEKDKKWDILWSDMVTKAKLSFIQRQVVAKYLRELLAVRIHEVESAVDMGWIIALIESENFGTDVSRGATKLLRVQDYAANVRNEAYGHDCIDGNGHWTDYDGCGLEHLKVRLKRYNVEYETNL